MIGVKVVCIDTMVKRNIGGLVMHKIYPNIIQVIFKESFHGMSISIKHSSLFLENTLGHKIVVNMANTNTYNASIAGLPRGSNAADGEISQ